MGLGGVNRRTCSLSYVEKMKWVNFDGYCVVASLILATQYNAVCKYY